MTNQRTPGLIALLIASLVLLFTAKCQAFDLKPDDWRPEDTKRQLAYTTIAILDAGQTADIQNHSDLEEVAPITRSVLGQQPKPSAAAAYFAGAIVLNYAVSAALPPKYRTWWQRTTIAVNGAVVANNYQLGLKWGF